VRVLSLLRKLGSHMPCRQKKKTKNIKNLRNDIVTNSIKTLKIVHIKKKKTTERKIEV